MSVTDLASLEAQLTSPDFPQNPYPVYTALREADPVHFVHEWGVWVVTTYADCVDILRNPRLFSNRGRFTSFLQQLPKDLQPEVQDMTRHNSEGMLQSDPPDHTRLRRLVQIAFTLKVVANLKPRVEAVINRLIGGIQQEGNQTDLMQSLAFLLPISVICDLLGVPAEDQQLIGRWARDVSSLQATGSVQYDRAKLASETIVEVERYFEALCNERRRRPKDDLISSMIAARDEGNKLTHGELINMCVNLLFAGHETTKALLGNAVYTLSRHSDQLADLNANQGLIEGAVEECLRYESPIQRGWRRIAEDTEYKGRKLRKDQLIYLMIGSANRDPAVFPEPDVFDIRRSDNEHIAFGTGVHFCLGAPLARLEARTALEILYRRLPKLEVVEAGRWAQSIHVRVLESLQVRF